MAEISVKDLQQRFKLSQELLEEECSNEHIRDIECLLESWETLASQIGLNNQQIDAIKNSKDREEVKRRSVLNTWKQTFAFRATYRELLKGLLATKRADIACKVCKLLTPKPNESQEKVLALQKLLKEVRQLIKSSPNTLEKEEILNLSTHLQDLMSVISKNIQLPGVPKSHAAQEMVAAPSQLDIASVLTPPQTITDDYNSNTEELSQSLSLPEVIDDDELPELDEPLLKRRRESEAVVQSLDKQKTFSCGISYTGDHKEKEFSDNAKKKIKAALPALKKHVHLFHYMVFATNDRIYCEHCKECPNDFKY